MAHEKEQKQYAEDCKHHKEPGFVPEYFSGLNWRDAGKLLGKTVEFSDEGCYWTLGTLSRFLEIELPTHRFLNELQTSYIYIRTCPETYHQDRHPTIVIGGVKLPRPEVESLGRGTVFWTWAPNTHFVQHFWCDDVYNREWLKAGIVHRTESRAQAWADWWESTVLAAVRGG